MTIWVILGLLVWVSLITLFISDDKFLPSFWLLAIPGALIATLTWDSMWVWVSGLSTTSLVLAPIFYVAAGFAVALVKWSFRSSKAAKFVASELKDGSHSLSDINYSLRARFGGLKVDNTDGTNKLVRSESFGEVIWAWVFWWPFVALASLFSDFIYNAIQMITGWMGGTFQAITDYFFKQANKGL